MIIVKNYIINNFDYIKISGEINYDNGFFTGRVKVIFHINKKQIETDYFNNKNELIDWLMDNEIVPRNKFSNLKLEEGV